MKIYQLTAAYVSLCVSAYLGFVLVHHGNWIAGSMMVGLSTIGALFVSDI